ncbi:hypothetical protein MTO96_041107 [Rhipicephalus appendiculatus]
MAGVEVPPVFKDLPVKVQTSKLVTRKELFCQLEEAAKTGSLADPVVRGLCQVLRLTLPRYHGSTSRHLVEQLVDSLLASQPSSAGHLISTILEVSRDHKTLFITKNLARTCLTAFSWSCKVGHQVLVNRGDLKPDKIRDLVEAQTNLLLSVSSACDPTLNKKLKRKINYLWKQVKTDLYAEVLSSLEPSYAVLLMWCYLIAYLDAQKQRDVIHSYKVRSHVCCSFFKGFQL